MKRPRSELEDDEQEDFVLDCRPSDPAESENSSPQLPVQTPNPQPRPEVVPCAGLVANAAQASSSAGRQGLTGRYFMAPDSAKRCFNCGGNGHNARECVEPKKTSICFLCAESGHESRNCPNELCFNCDQPGHQARVCTGAPCHH